MPEGYQCDGCGAFNSHKHKMTTLNVSSAVAEDHTLISQTYTVCPKCATELRAELKDIDLPDGWENEL